MPASTESAARRSPRERTTLAQNRSGLAIVICVAALLQNLWSLRAPDRSFAVGLVLVVVMAWAAFATVAVWIHRNRLSQQPIRIQRRLGLVSAGTFLLAIGAVVLSLFASG